MTNNIQYFPLHQYHWVYGGSGTPAVFYTSAFIFRFKNQCNKANKKLRCYSKKINNRLHYFQFIHISGLFNNKKSHQKNIRIMNMHPTFHIAGVLVLNHSPFANLRAVSYAT